MGLVHPGLQPSFSLKTVSKLLVKWSLLGQQYAAWKTTVLFSVASLKAEPSPVSALPPYVPRRAFVLTYLLCHFSHWLDLPPGYHGAGLWLKDCQRSLSDHVTQKIAHHTPGTHCPPTSSFFMACQSFAYSSSSSYCLCAFTKIKVNDGVGVV